MTQVKQRQSYETRANRQRSEGYVSWKASVKMIVAILKQKPELRMNMDLGSGTWKRDITDISDHDLEMFLWRYELQIVETYHATKETGIKKPEGVEF